MEVVRITFRILKVLRLIVLVTSLLIQSFTYICSPIYTVRGSAYFQDLKHDILFMGKISNRICT